MLGLESARGRGMEHAFLGDSASDDDRTHWCYHRQLMRTSLNSKHPSQPQSPQDDSGCLGSRRLGPRSTRGDCPMSAATSSSGGGGGSAAAGASGWGAPPPLAAAVVAREEGGGLKEVAMKAILRQPTKALVPASVRRADAILPVSRLEWMNGRRRAVDRTG